MCVWWWWWWWWWWWCVCGRGRYCHLRGVGGVEDHSHGSHSQHDHASPRRVAARTRAGTRMLRVDSDSAIIIVLRRQRCALHAKGQDWIGHLARRHRLMAMSATAAALPHMRAPVVDAAAAPPPSSSVLGGIALGAAVCLGRECARNAARQMSTSSGKATSTPASTRSLRGHTLPRAVWEATRAATHYHSLPQAAYRCRAKWPESCSANLTL